MCVCTHACVRACVVMMYYCELACVFSPQAAEVEMDLFGGSEMSNQPLQMRGFPPLPPPGVPPPAGAAPPPLGAPPSLGGLALSSVRAVLSLSTGLGSSMPVNAKLSPPSSTRAAAPIVAQQQQQQQVMSFEPPVPARRSSKYAYWVTLGVTVDCDELL